MDWSSLYSMPLAVEDGSSQSRQPHRVEFADIGCGYGGLLGQLTNYW